MTNATSITGTIDSVLVGSLTKWGSVISELTSVVTLSTSVVSSIGPSTASVTTVVVGGFLEP